MFNMLQFIGFRNYIELFSNDTLFRPALGNTVRLYALTTLIVGSTAILLHINLRNRSKTAYQWTFATLLPLALIILYYYITRNLMVSLVFNFFALIDHPITTPLFLFLPPLVATLGFLHIPWERWHKSLRLIAALVVPLLLTRFLETYLQRGWIREMNWQVTLSHLARDSASVRLEMGYAAAITANTLLTILFTAIIVVVILLVPRIRVLKASKHPICQDE